MPKAKKKRKKHDKTNTHASILCRGSDMKKKQTKQKQSKPIK